MMWDDSTDSVHSRWEADTARPVQYVTWDEPRDPAWIAAILVLVALAVTVLALAG